MKSGMTHSCILSRLPEGQSQSASLSILCRAFLTQVGRPKITIKWYDALRKLAHRLDIAIIVVHHCKKSTDVASAPLEKVIGSIGITGTAETVMVMEQLPGSKDCKLHVTGKDVEQCEKHLAWNGHGFEINDDAIAAQLGSTQKLVLMLIQEAPRCTQKYVVEAIGKDQGQLSSFNSELCVDLRLRQTAE